MSVMDDSVRQSGKSLRWTSSVIITINKIINVEEEKKSFTSVWGTLWLFQWWQLLQLIASIQHNVCNSSRCTVAAPHVTTERDRIKHREASGPTFCQIQVVSSCAVSVSFSKGVIKESVYLWHFHSQKWTPEQFYSLNPHTTVQLDTVYVDYRIIDIWHLWENYTVYS